MKNILITICLFTIGGIYATNTITTENTIIGKKKIEFNTSEKDAEIFINGRKVGEGQAIISVPKDNCIYVIAKKIGFITEKIEFCNKKELEKLPATYTLNMQLDEAYTATINSSFVNRDITLTSNTIPKDQAWKTINQIILSYVDVIDMMDKETGYLRTHWTVNTYTQNTLRSRFIVKESSSDPLIFKVKLVSEQSGQTLTNVTNDQLFKSWDRVLKNYADAIEELQTRIK